MRTVHDEAQSQQGEGRADGDEAHAEEEQAEQVMGMLHEHVPLSLLVDLAAPSGPHSDEILDAEGEPETAWWEQTVSPPQR